MHTKIALINRTIKYEEKVIALADGLWLMVWAFIAYGCSSTICLRWAVPSKCVPFMSISVNAHHSNVNTYSKAYDVSCSCRIFTLIP